MRDFYYSIPEDLRGITVVLILSIIVFPIYVAIMTIRVKFTGRDKMRTIKTDNGTTFHHNNDWSGDLIVVLPTGAVEASTGGDVLVTISMETVKGFIGEYLRDLTIRNFESLTTDEIIDYAVFKDVSSTYEGHSYKA